MIDTPTILTDCGIALIGLAVGYAVCWFNEISPRDREIVDLTNEKRDVEDHLDRVIKSRNKNRAELAKKYDEISALTTELTALKATAITRDAKGHFTKAKA